VESWSLARDNKIFSQHKVKEFKLENTSTDMSSNVGFIKKQWSSPLMEIQHSCAKKFKNLKIREKSLRV